MAVAAVNEAAAIAAAKTKTKTKTKAKGNINPTSRDIVVKVDIAKEMRMFDALPPPLRRRLAECTLNVSCDRIYQQFKNGRPISLIISAIDRFEQTKAQELDRQEGWDRPNLFSAKER